MSRGGGGVGGEEGRGSESLQTEYKMGTLKFLILTFRPIFSITLLTLLTFFCLSLGGDSLKTCFYLSFIYVLIFSLACL